MSKVVSGRVPDELAEWLDGYAKQRGATRAAVLASAIEALRGDAAGGVPEVRPAPVLNRAVPDVPGVKRGSDLLADRQRALNKKIQGWS